jgi:1-acyl-sn-glycerol-3-phosphate acyltransferase
VKWGEFAVFGVDAAFTGYSGAASNDRIAIDVTDSSQFALLGQRRFAPFFLTQFLGALNDNVFRNGLVILVTFQGVLVLGLNHSQLANVASLLFILPFFLLSATAGQLADKYEKSLLMRRIKLLEIGLMLIAASALQTESYPLLLFVLFLMGCQSTLFGPVKYAYLPQQLAVEELVGGNALIEAGTYVAIILGLIIGGIAVAIDSFDRTLLAALLVGFAILGYLASQRIPTTRAADPDLKFNWNTWTETWHIVGFAREDRTVFLSILGISWFWFFGTVMTVQVPAYTLDILNGNEAITTTLLVAFAVGVGIGSLLCERMSGHRIELGLVPFGSIGLSLFAIDLFFAKPIGNVVPVASVADFLAVPGNWRVLLDLIIAANNIINTIFMVAASLLAIFLLNLGLSIPELFLVLAALNIVVAIYIYSLLPEFLMRFLAWILINVLYRIRITGLENIPKHGPAVVVCNHVSFMDPILLAGSIKRPMRFVMYYRIFQIPLLRFFFEHMSAIPIAGAMENEQLMNEAFERVDEELEAGNVVCIFPEGGITRDGHVQRFRPGIEKIIARRPVPVVPVALGRLWGSWFSRRTGGGVRTVPGRLFARVPITVGEAVAASDVTAARLELLVRTLRGDER